MSNIPPVHIETPEHNGRHHIKFTEFISQLNHYEDCITALNLITIKISEFEKNV